jgi:predicted Zn-dependent peptidase
MATAIARHDRTTLATSANPGLAGREHRLTELDSGVRVVTEAVPSVRSIALGMFVGTGSRNEAPAQAGVSHFLEHLLFKGTKRFSSVEIDQIFDGMGAEVNAGTGKETTSVYSRFLDQHLERALDVMADMVLRPAYPDIDSERQVVIEEIAMYEDEPSEKVHDVLAQAVFGDHPLGLPIIGSAEVISSVPVPDIARYHGSRYVASNVVVSAAGNLDHDQLVEMVAKCVTPPPGTAEPAQPAPSAIAPRACFHSKQTEQYHLCLGGPGIPRADERRFALRVLDTILGGSSSSRLFQEVREKRGLAYAVYSYSSQYVDSGQVGVYVGTRPDNVTEAMDVIASELRRIATEPVEADELQRAKENVKGRLALSLESTLTRMNRLGGSVLMGMPLLSLDEMVEAIDVVSAEDVAQLADELFAPERMSAAGVGGDEDAFLSALEPVNPELRVAA